MALRTVPQNIAATCRCHWVRAVRPLLHTGPVVRLPAVVWLPLLLSVACAGAKSTGTSGTDKTNNETVNPTVSPTTNEPDDETQDSTEMQTSAAGSSEVRDTTTNEDPQSVVKGVTRAGAKCDRTTRLGSLSVNLGTDRTIVAGAVSNGVLPSSIASVHSQEGGCELLVPRDLFCTSCESSEACAGDDMCVPKPTKVSAGAVSVVGLLVDTEVSPNGITLDYSKTILDPYPAYEVGAAVSFEARGDVIPAFAAEVYGVPKLTSGLSVVAVKHGEATQLEWDNTDVDAEQSNVFISFSVNVHGAVTGWIECTAPDTGSFELPAEMVSTLIDLGLSGFPRVELERRSSATVELEDGCVDVYVGSKVTLEIEVDGLASCNKDTDCPEGQSCSEELACE